MSNCIYLGMKSSTYWPVGRLHEHHVSFTCKTRSKRGAGIPKSKLAADICVVIVVNSHPSELEHEIITVSHAKCCQTSRNEIEKW